MRCPDSQTLATLLLLALSPTALGAAPGGDLCGNGLPDPGEECDDGNQVNGDGCSSMCLIESKVNFDCTPAIPGTPPVNLISDGSFEEPVSSVHWTWNHSVFDQAALCDDSCFGDALASDIDGSITTGSFLLVAGGTFSEDSSGFVEHVPVVFSEDATTLSFNYGIGSRELSGNCPGLDDGLTLFIDGNEIWSSTDAGPCVAVDVYTVVDVDISAYADGHPHIVRFEGAASHTMGPGPDDNDLTNIFLDQIRILVEADDAQPPIPSVCTVIECGDGQIPRFSGIGIEQCDDGNTSDGDGCSSTCFVEQPNFVCIDPQPPADEGNAIANGGFEGGSGWIAAGPGGSGEDAGLICSQALCGTAQANRGAWYTWFGRLNIPGSQSIEQSLTIPPSADTLDFALRTDRCDSASDVLTVEIDGTVVYTRDCQQPLAEFISQSVDISAFADGLPHTVRFAALIQSVNGGISDFFVDDVRLGTNLPFDGEPGVCTQLPQACSPPEPFDSALPAGWTRINVGDDSNDGWGVSNDGLCASQNWSSTNALNNETGGGGSAACADSDATGQIDTDNALPIAQMDTYLCSPSMDLSAVTDPAFHFLVNYQAASVALDDNGVDADLLEVVGGVAPPDQTSLASYVPLLNIIDHLDTDLTLTPRRAAAASLADFTNESEVYVCFHYRGTFAWFAQVDNAALRAAECEAAPDSDGDGVDDLSDNCTLVSNPTQLDTDGDGYGNRCDADFNDDCVVNVADLGILRTLFFQPNNEADLNGDGITQGVDLGIFRTLFLQPPGPSTVDTCQ